MTYPARNQLLYTGLLLLMAVLFSGCEKVTIVPDDDQGGGKVSGRSKVTVNASFLDTEETVAGTTRSLVKVADVCTKVSIAIYRDGTRVKYENQTVGTAGFGTFSANLDAGTYEVMILAHSNESSPATTSPTSIRFTKQLTDVFKYYDKITVDGTTPRTVDATLHRAVARLRILQTKALPKRIVRLVLDWNSSRTLDVVSGFSGEMKAESITIGVRPEMYSGGFPIDIYTFLPTNASTTDLLVTAIYSNNTSKALKKFVDIPLAINTTTVYEGDLTDEYSGADAKGTTIVTDTAWVYRRYHF